MECKGTKSKIDKKMFVHLKPKLFPCLRFLIFEALTVQQARSYGKRPRAGETASPLFSAEIGEPTAKRRRGAAAAVAPPPAVAPASAGTAILVSFYEKTWRLECVKDNSIA
jgi:hypothetical protein